MSIKDKITPGPWKIVANGIIAPKGSVMSVRWFLNGDPDKIVMYDEAQANLRACHAVPEMLDILEWLKEWNLNGQQDHALLNRLCYQNDQLLNELNNI